jgi:hypothetical protein
MRHVRRLTALLASFLFAHLLWAGSGFACAMPATPGAPSPSVAMAGMDMSGDMAHMNMAGMEMPGTTQQESGQPPAHHHTSCEFPSAPGDCQSMTACAPLALASAAELPGAPHVVPPSVTVLAELAPPSPVSPPESPPPRA